MSRKERGEPSIETVFLGDKRRFTTIAEIAMPEYVTGEKFKAAAEKLRRDLDRHWSDAFAYCRAGVDPHFGDGRRATGDAGHAYDPISLRCSRCGTGMSAEVDGLSPSCGIEIIVDQNDRRGLDALPVGESI